MAYTDTLTTNSSPIKKVHVTELKTQIDNLRSNKKCTDIQSPTLSYTTVNSENIRKIQDAINALELRFSYNCCQSSGTSTCQTSKCQSCQNTCVQCTNKCESCQDVCSQCTDRCQSCQNTCICQSDKCQAQCSQCKTPDCNCSWDCQSH